MPRVMFEVSEMWLKRFNDVIPATIDTLFGLEHRILNHKLEGVVDSDDLLQQLMSQLSDLRRNLESTRIIF